MFSYKKFLIRNIVYILMAEKLVHVIAKQFLKIVKKRWYDKCCEKFKKCSFEYHSQEHYHVIVVEHKKSDKCDRIIRTIAKIDHTNICIDDLTSEKWLNYLEEIAYDFVDNICPRKIVIVKKKEKKCKVPPPVVGPFPCKKVTVVYRKVPHKKKRNKKKKVIEQCQKCIKKCDHKKRKCEKIKVIKYEC